jgi:hypothetical protein
MRVSGSNYEIFTVNYEIFTVNYEVIDGNIFSSYYEAFLGNIDNYHGVQQS